MARTILTFIALIAFSVAASAACRVQWVDHDFNVMTPPIQKQVCDNTLDLPAINLPGVRPIQRPAIKPIEPIGLPPLGTQYCSTQQVYNNNTMRWETKRLCR